MRTDAELDVMHDDVVARYPEGMTPAQYRQVVLESADSEGRVYPHSIDNYFTKTSLLIGMWFDGLLTHWDDGSGRPIKQQPSNYRITDKGRDALVAMQASPIPHPAENAGGGE